MSTNDNIRVVLRWLESRAALGFKTQSRAWEKALRGAPSHLRTVLDWRHPRLRLNWCSETNQDHSIWRHEKIFSYNSVYFFFYKSGKEIDCLLFVRNKERYNVHQNVFATNDVVATDQKTNKASHFCIFFSSWSEPLASPFFYKMFLYSFLPALSHRQGVKISLTSFRRKNFVFPLRIILLQTIFSF